MSWTIAVDGMGGDFAPQNVVRGDADVIITDGFTGNVALKVSESVAEAMALMIEQEMTRTVFSRLKINEGIRELAAVRQGTEAV